MSKERRKVALVTGITGQDGSYLAELLLDKGYEVHGVVRRASTFNTKRIDHLHDDEKLCFHLHYGDVGDMANMMMLVSKVLPDEVYNLAAQSHVQVSFEMPVYSAQVNALGTLHILEAVRAAGLTKTTRIYQASTSELYGLIQEPQQSEETPFYPRSPYAVSKLYSYWIMRNYREAYGMFASNGILFNHESPRRGRTFVTRKITDYVAKSARSDIPLEPLTLGNLDAKRDWGHAREYVEGMWRILQHPQADDFVLATGQTHSVRKFVELAFAQVGVFIHWEGQGLDEIGVDQNGRTQVQVSEKYYRPTEVDVLLGDPSKAKRLLGWEAQTSLRELAEEMIHEEMKTLIER